MSVLSPMGSPMMKGGGSIIVIVQVASSVGVKELRGCGYWAYGVKRLEYDEYGSVLLLFAIFESYYFILCSTFAPLALNKLLC